jgi:hypothetical protein
LIRKAPSGEKVLTQNDPFISRHGLDQHGITDIAAAYWNYPVEALYEEAPRR